MNIEIKRPSPAAPTEVLTRITVATGLISDETLKSKWYLIELRRIKSNDKISSFEISF